MERKTKTNFTDRVLEDKGNQLALNNKSTIHSLATIQA
jgi:hypothetical protein